MNFTYLDLTILNSKHHMQLGLDDSVSCPAVYGASKAHCSFLLSFLCNMNRCAILFPRSFQPSSADENEMSFFLIVYGKRTTCRLALGP